MSSNVFVSYGKPNSAAVRSLVDFLKGAGVTVWFDRDELLAGQDWNQVIMREISSAKLFLICLSAEVTDRRGYFYKEMRTALDVAMKIPPSELYIMPVRLNECPIPVEIERYHVLDLFEEGASQVLLRSISSALGIPLVAGAGTKLVLVGPALKNGIPSGLSERARSLLEEILRDSRSDAKGVTVASLTATQGSYVPYLWDNSVHGGLHVDHAIPITRTLQAIDELVRANTIEHFHSGGALRQWALKPEFYPAEEHDS